MTKTKQFKISPFKMEMEKNGFVKGFILKRELTYKECAHITRDLLGIDFSLILDDLDSKEDKDDYKEELIEDVTFLLNGKMADADFLNALDCDAMDDEGLGIWCAFPIITYLQKIEAI